MDQDGTARLAALIIELRRLQRSTAPAQPAGPDRSQRPMSHREVLDHVSKHPGTGTSGIAKALQLAPNTVSSIVSVLVKDGSLIRTSDPRDKRASRLYVSATLAAQRSARMDQRTERMDAVLSLLDEEQLHDLERAIPAFEALRDAMVRIRGHQSTAHSAD